MSPEALPAVNCGLAWERRGFGLTLPRVRFAATELETRAWCACPSQGFPPARRSAGQGGILRKPSRSGGAFGLYPRHGGPRGQPRWRCRQSPRDASLGASPVEGRPVTRRNAASGPKRASQPPQGVGCPGRESPGTRQTTSDTRGGDAPQGTRPLCTSAVWRYRGPLGGGRRWQPPGAARAASSSFPSKLRSSPARSVRCCQVTKISLP